MTFAPPAPPGAGGDSFACKDHFGELVVIEVLATKPEVETKHGKADAISANVTVIAGAQPGAMFKDALIFGSVIYNQLKGNVGQRVLVRITQGQASGGKNPPWIVDASTVTEAEQQQAVAMLAQASMGQPAPAAGPPTAPPQQAYAPPPVAQQQYQQPPVGQPVQPQTF